MVLDLNKLAHLIAVAEEGGFTRAARRLHLSQQALSTSVRALEREVGVDLLDRSGAKLTVLPAGEALIADARLLHGAARSALLRARRIGRGEPEMLRIGHTPAVAGDEVTALLHRVHDAKPDLSTQVNQRYPGELTEQLIAGELDLGLCRGMEPEPGLSRATLAHHRLRVAVPAGHRFARRESVEFGELTDETIVMWGRPGRSGYTDLLIAHCRRAGFEPVVRRNPIQGTPPVTAVQGGDDVALVTAPAGPSLGGAVQVVDLLPPTFAPLHALWPANTLSPAREDFLSAATEH
ncbi:LysR substrate-binding domain-containing protein [Saccharopolyspora sp. TS4A08]|uniref:LysR substrate-binding domain-containing protein n=1 Tax=Saccharopolyspora ipomoeae TaxID=3042027 RepID=A0ABT6PPP2_9PSEU|nr:LysR substrate-binding domain-containing protein [Saccharopolyspora sp. TS4A08]MDI2029967.1 LysR substrate-binding domain-containing protein [Saccharopolyspora sp. TS4A08]